MTIGQPRLLLVDSYDSFTHNLAALFRRAIPNVQITIIKNDTLPIEELRPHLSQFAAIVIGPGPGSPDNNEDIGVVRDLWKLKDQDVLPIFGVCLGLQSLAIEHNAQLKRLDTVKHGLISSIHHHSTDIFDNVGPVNAVRYHSLHVKLDNADEIQELAWADDEENGKVVMAIRHKSRPFWAVQYHPESVCTNGGGLQVVQNFWALAQSWSNSYGRRISPWNTNLESLQEMETSWPYPVTPILSPILPSDRGSVVTSILKRTDLSVPDLCEAFGASEESSRFALLESASPPGKYSIIGCLTSSTPHIQYRIGNAYVSITSNGHTSYEALESQDIWSWVGKFMHPKTYSGNPELPFWGGLIGYLSYELGVQNLHIPLRQTHTLNESKHPDVNLVFVERSIVIDSQTGKTYVQSIAPKDHRWVDETVARLEKLDRPSCWESTSLTSCKASIVLPNKGQYISNIKQAKEHLFAGDSYELCLTAPTHISITPPSPSSSPRSSSWERYKRLRKANPAPHSAYLRLHPSTLLSSSPERFLSYSRAPGTICQLRPIKGTVRKAPHITRAVAEQALVGSPKEVAENLMIVDLIRHDLHGVVGEDVVVKQFCSIEEYETVWQLVSVIEGRLTDVSRTGAEDQLGWKVLKESLPPGSMTGAPKKRSVEILQDLEGQERGIYSGVFGYWCVGGGGDWSVTIRSCFKYQERNGSKQEDGHPSSEEWVIGAGGAITALSDPESEWEEMVTKLQSVLRAFGALDPDFS